MNNAKKEATVLRGADGLEYVIVGGKVLEKYLDEILEMHINGDDTRGQVRMVQT